MTIVCTTKEPSTDKRHHTIIVAPGHRDFIKSMTTGTFQADVALIMVTVDGNSNTAIAEVNHEAAEIQGRIRQHSRSINFSGVRQTRIGVNRIDCDAAGCKHERKLETSNEVRSMLMRLLGRDLTRDLVKEVADESFVQGQTQASL